MEKIVLATGVFDIIHPGHLFYLNESKKLGNKLIVIVANDKTVLKKKNRKTIFNHFERQEIIQNLKCVDLAVIGSENDFIKTAAELNPDIITFGWDQKFNEIDLKNKFKEFNLDIEIVQIPRFKDYSSGKARISL